MKISLVSPPRTTLFDPSGVTPPLGLLTLSRLAEEAGWESEVVDFNLEYHLDGALRENFYELASERLIASEPDVLGFTSMGVDTHVALEMARRVKESSPGTRIVCGGAHFSSISDRVLSNYPWIDCVINGPAEGIWIPLLKRLDGRGKSTIPQVVRGKGQIPPLPDYSVVDLPRYWQANTERVIDVESGRGCTQRCSFCYSPRFWGKAIPTFGVDRTVGHLVDLADLGTKHVFFVEDNFLNRPRKTIDLCEALRDANLPISWNCYGITAGLTSRVISSLRGAGCNSVFIGVDGVGRATQKSFGKEWVGVGEDYIPIFRALIQEGITPTAAFMVAPPSHPLGADFEETVGACLAARLEGCDVRLNTLAVYPDTDLQDVSELSLFPDEVRIGTLFDVPEFVEDNPLADAAPHLFPFHSRYADADEWARFVGRVFTLWTLLFARAEEMFDILAYDHQSSLGVADRVIDGAGSLSELSKQNRRTILLEVFDGTF